MAILADCFGSLALGSASFRSLQYIITLVTVFTTNPTCARDFT